MVAVVTLKSGSIYKVVTEAGDADDAIAEAKAGDPLVCTNGATVSIDPADISSVYVPGD